MVEEPTIGMMFDSEDEAFSYYKQYAKQVSFGVTKRSHRLGDDGKVRYFTIACLREGKSKGKKHLISLGQNQWREWGARQRSMQK